MNLGVKKMEISKATIQDLNLELIKRATFNGFNGEKVVKSLNKHRDLWKSALMDGECIVFPKLERRQTVHDIYWIKLRDLDSDIWNVDTLFIIPQDGKEQELLKIAKRWYADEVDYIKVDEGGLVNTNILRLWWD